MLSKSGGAEVKVDLDDAGGQSVSDARGNTSLMISSHRQTSPHTMQSSRRKQETGLLQRSNRNRSSRRHTTMRTTTRTRIWSPPCLIATVGRLQTWPRKRRKKTIWKTLHLSAMATQGRTPW